MKKIVLFVLGPDGPGIIASISEVLYREGGNLEDVSQTILQNEFICIFIISVPDTANENDLLDALRSKLEPLGLFACLKTAETVDSSKSQAGEPFVITAVGPDRPGLIAGIAEVIARHHVNITNLKAVSRVDRKPPDYITIYEVDVPPSTEYRSFRTDLQTRAQELGLDVNIQHREIFEKIYQV
jgi:glycine cleavage system transcriptional repressor